MNDEEVNYTAEEFLNWLCWMWADDGERFYPPDKTAAEFVSGTVDKYKEEYSDIRLSNELTCVYEWEEGYHIRAYNEAVSKFDDCKMWGFDPVERAARYHYEHVWTEDNAVEKMDWSWYNR